MCTELLVSIGEHNQMCKVWHAEIITVHDYIIQIQLLLHSYMVVDFQNYFICNVARYT